MYRARVTDQCVCYKVMEGDIARGLKIETKGFEVCSEITAKVCRRGYAIWEVPIYYEPRTVEQGKKINAIDALRALVTLFLSI